MSVGRAGLAARLLVLTLALLAAGWHWESQCCQATLHPCLPVLIVCAHPAANSAVTAGKVLYLTLLIHSFQAVVRKNVFPPSHGVPHSIADAVLLSFTCQDVLNDSAFSSLMAGDTANRYQSLQLASNLCVMQRKGKSLVYNGIRTKYFSCLP